MIVYAGTVFDLPLVWVGVAVLSIVSIVLFFQIALNAVVAGVFSELTMRAMPTVEQQRIGVFVFRLRNVKVMRFTHGSSLLRIIISFLYSTV